MKRLTIEDLLKKKNSEQICMLTAYDYPSAQILDRAGVDILLVGDSLGMVMYGFETTLPVSIDMMCLHGAAVVKGSQQAFVVVDMPFGSYQVSMEQACQNAIEIMKRTNAQAVKLEGGVFHEKTIAHLVSNGIPVMAHIGVTPQSIHQLSSYRKRGKSTEEAIQMMKDAKAVAKAGAFCLVLEGVDESLAGEISSGLSIPTIGIASGKKCDGQVLVTHDLLGLCVDGPPPFVKPMIELHKTIHQNVLTYISQVKKS